MYVRKYGAPYISAILFSKYFISFFQIQGRRAFPCLFEVRWGHWLAWPVRCEQKRGAPHPGRDLESHCLSHHINSPLLWRPWKYIVTGNLWQPGPWVAWISGDSWQLLGLQVSAESTTWLARTTETWALLPQHNLVFAVVAMFHIWICTRPTPGCLEREFFLHLLLFRRLRRGDYHHFFKSR